MTTEAPPPTTLVDFIRLKAAQAPEQMIFTFLLDGETEHARLTLGEVDTQARALAAQLQTQTRPGDRALLVFPSSPDAVVAMMGCVYAGVVPVTVLPPPPGQPPENLLGILADTRAAVALTNRGLQARLQPVVAGHKALAELPWLAIDSPSAATPDDWEAVRPDPNDVIGLIYTSGSTQQPRGIVITQGHMMRAMQMIQYMPPPPPGSLTVTWMPVQHTAGLSAMIYPLVSGVPLVLMPPQAFLERPARWLEAITRYRATNSGGANFAYELCVARTTPEERAGLDLSTWTQAGVGTGPVHGRTLEEFAETFEPYGFKREAFFVHYGLSETTSVISAMYAPGTLALDRAALAENRAVKAAPDDLDPVRLVSGGYPMPMVDVSIVDPATLTLCPPEAVGEIWVPASYGYGGYYNKPAETEATFGGRLADDPAAGPFLRTGDMGALIDGEVYITGRLKDMLIVRGRNFYAEDLEQIAGRAHPALVPGAAAAFSLPGPAEEQVTILHEVQPGQTQVDVDAVSAAIRRAIAAAFALPVQAVALVPSGALPRTVSGKIQRHLARAQYQAALDRPTKHRG